MQNLPNTSIHYQEWESNAWPFDVESDALSTQLHGPTWSRIIFHQLRGAWNWMLWLFWPPLGYTDTFFSSFLVIDQLLVNQRWMKPVAVTTTSKVMLWNKAQSSDQVPCSTLLSHRSIITVVKFNTQLCMMVISLCKDIMQRNKIVLYVNAGEMFCLE